MRLMTRAAAVLTFVVAMVGWTDVSARAATINFDPSAATTTSGGSLTLNLQGTGLGGTPTTVIGGFDVTVSWDPSALQFNAATFGSALGTLPGEAITITTPSTGSVELFENSLLDPTSLAALQNGTAVLANLSWNALGAQTSQVSVSGLVSDALGNKLSVEFGSAQLNPVPEPSMGRLSALSLLMLGVFVMVRRYQNSASSAAGG